MRNKRFFLAGFCIYALLMLYLMFHRVPYAERNCNLIPGRTIQAMIRLLGLRPSLRRLAIVNLFGNILMFLPLGLLPAIWEQQNHFPVYLLTVALSVCLLEAAQYLTRLGSADVDDLLLNLLGASLGFLIWKWISGAKAA